MKCNGSTILLAIFILCSSTVNCQLSLFQEKDDIAQRNVEVNEKDKLHLFTNTKSCSELVIEDLYTTINKDSFCKDHCDKIIEKINPEKKAEENLTQEDLKQKKDIAALHYYKSFIHSFLNFIDLEKYQNDEELNLDLNFKLTKYKISRLKMFSESENDSLQGGISLPEITDTLKDMIVTVDDHQTKPNLAPIISTANLDIIKNINLEYLVIFSLPLIMVILISLNNRYHFRFPWRYFILCMIFVAFAMSVSNNHKYLAKKKEILNQQRLKEDIPQECILHDNKGALIEKKTKLNKMFDLLMSPFKTRPTSKVCLDYHEALYINAYQNNYFETIIYTVTEGLRPFASGFGDFINQFFSALTKDMSFYQYVPLIGMVTIIMVPVALFIISLLSLLIFGYEFNFFHLISFKKNTSKPSNDDEKDQKLRNIEEKLAILCKIRNIDEKKLLSLRFKENESASNKLMIENKTESDGYSLNESKGKSISERMEKDLSIIDELLVEEDINKENKNSESDQEETTIKPQREIMTKLNNIEDKKTYRNNHNSPATRILRNSNNFIKPDGQKSPLRTKSNKNTPRKSARLEEKILQIEKENILHDDNDEDDENDSDSAYLIIGDN